MGDRVDKNGAIIGAPLFTQQLHGVGRAIAPFKSENEYARAMAKRTRAASSANLPDWPAAEGYRFRIHWDDTDTTKRVYLGKYIKWIDDACTEFLRERGMVFDPDGWLSLDGKPLSGSFVVGEYSCRIEHSSFFDDVLTVRISVQERRPRVLIFRGDIIDETGKLVAAGTLTYIYIKKQKGGLKAVKMPQKVAGRL
jgi:YbgC/YbaW family acyl-CoA thioester hydrolase